MTAISTSQAIRNAIEAELAAARFYRLLADSTEDRESQAFLSGLADQEVLHAKAIEQKGLEIADEPLPARADSDVETIETLPEWRFAENLTMLEALEVALAAETQAALYYDAFSDYLDGPAKAFFAELARTEEEHAKRVAERRDAVLRKSSDKR
jgi:rubrerythrin